MLQRLFGGRAERQVTIERRRGESNRSRWGAAAMATRRRRVRVVEVRPETADAVIVRIAPLDGQPLSYRAGQYLTHCLRIDGEELRRAYSMCEPPRGDTLAFCCRRVADGRVSGHLNAGLVAGAEYEILGPSGDFVLDQDAAMPLVFVAGGSGITPVIAMLEQALEDQSGRDCRLIYANRDENSILFAKRLAALQERHPQLRITHVLSRPGAGWDGETGRLDGARTLALAAAAPDAIWFLCGPVGLMDAVGEALTQSGVAAGRIRRESFASATHASSRHPDTPQPIRFARSGEQVMQQPGQSILAAGLAAGLALDFSCTVGGCGACKVRVIDGAVSLDEPNCLTEEERAQGYTLACSAYATAPAEVDA